MIIFYTVSHLTLVEHTILAIKKLLAIALLVLSGSVLATETVRIIIPTAPGGPVDAGGRLLQQTLTQHIDPKIATFVVENHAGAGTAIGNKLVAKNKKKETMLLLQSQALVINYLLNPDAFDLRTDLTPVIYIGDVQSVLAASKRTKLNSIDDLIKKDKTTPLFYGTGGVGTSAHLTAEMLESQLGRKNGIMVPYKGQGPALIALAGNEVDLVLLGANAAIGQKDKITLLATTGTERHPAIPDVPSLAEKNIKIPSNYLMLFSNTTADPALIKLIKQSIIIAAVTPAEAEKYRSAGIDFNTNNLNKTANFVTREINLLEPSAKKLRDSNP